MAIVPASSGLFAVLGQTNFDQLDKAIKEKYPNGSLALVPGQWLLAVPTVTTKELSESLGIIGDNAIGSAIIVSVSNYFGRANPQIWEWIRSRIAS
jgi:hypothetical protein